MASYLKDTGLKIKGYSELLAGLKEDTKNGFGEEVNLENGSPLGMFLSLVALNFADLHSTMLSIYNNKFVDTASGTSLDKLVYGILNTRNQPTKASGKQLFFANVNSINIGNETVVGTSANVNYETQNDVVTTKIVNHILITNGTSTGGIISIGGDDFSIPSGFLPDDVKLYILLGYENNGSDNWYIIDNGVEAELLFLNKNETPTTFDFDAGTTTCAATLTTPYEYYQEDDITCLVVGNYNVEANTLTKMGTNIAGITRTTNQTATINGYGLETDAELRLRYLEALQLNGKSTAQSILSALDEIDGVKQSFLLENYTNSIDVNGVQPKSFEVVYKGDSLTATYDSIAGVIHDLRPLGISSDGSISHSITVDKEGSITEKFSRATEVSVPIEFTITKNNKWSIGYINIINNTILNYIAEIEIGGLISLSILTALIYNSVVGIENITGLKLNSVASDYQLNSREFAVTYSSDITITVS